MRSYFGDTTLADIESVDRVCTGWRPPPVPIRQPEHINSPKEHLEKLSRDSRKKPRYSHATHNPRFAEYIDLAKVYRKCPSFRPLRDFILQ